jgi:hypothetical protein
MQKILSAICGALSLLFAFWSVIAVLLHFEPTPINLLIVSLAFTIISGMIRYHDGKDSQVSRPMSGQ